jgi:hypothetical protein
LPIVGSPCGIGSSISPLTSSMSMTGATPMGSSSGC